MSLLRVNGVKILIILCSTKHRSKHLCITQQINNSFRKPIQITFEKSKSIPMRRFTSTDYSVTSFNVTMLLLRVAFGAMILLNHGIPKLQKFAKLQSSFFDPFGIGSKWALILVIFAEVFCAILVIIGLFSRLAVIPLIVTMVVIIFMANKGEPLVKSELPILLLCGFAAVLLAGPGRLSVDGVIGR